MRRSLRSHQRRSPTPCSSSTRRLRGLVLRAPSSRPVTSPTILRLLADRRGSSRGTEQSPRPPSQSQPSSSTNVRTTTSTGSPTRRRSPCSCRRSPACRSASRPTAGTSTRRTCSRPRPAGRPSSASSPGARPGLRAAHRPLRGRLVDLHMGVDVTGLPRSAGGGTAGGPAHPPARRRGKPVTRQGPAAPDRGSPRVACGRVLGLLGHPRRGARTRTPDRPDPRARARGLRAPPGDAAACRGPGTLCGTPTTSS